MSALAQQTAPSSANQMIDVQKVRDAQLHTSPYQYMLATDFIKPDAKKRLIEGYPQIEQAGSFPLPTIQYGADFKQLIDELNSDEFRQAVEEKFKVDLAGKPTMFTVRGKCRAKDGKIHTDSESKIITVLLYMNPEWENDGGRLRILNNGTDLNGSVAEVPPMIGSLLLFKRSNNSWHGHLPFEGTRRVIQMNWVTEQKYVDREQKRHFWSSLLKRLGVSY